MNLETLIVIHEQVIGSLKSYIFKLVFKVAAA